ncbi:MAG: signal transduction histidine kinase/ligand-binding sensor domain-containing protein [Cyclobacteriaceae bacterium]|jgi:signal transduction histidine kinase/ligand-binding sensor domain-containing protein
MRLAKKLLIAFIFCYISLFNLCGQDRNFTHFTLRSGIPSGYISKMIEDQYGYIWIGTTGGLSRFDGYEFVNYTQKAKDATSLKGSFVSCIKDYDSATLIVATVEALNIYNRLTGEFRLVQVADSLPPVDDITDVVVMKNKDLWVLTKNGLYFITAANLNSMISKVEFFEYPELNDQGSARLGSMVYDGNQTLWFGSASQSLQKFDIEKKEFVPIGPFKGAVAEFMKEAIWDMVIVPNGDLFVVGDKGLLRWKSNTKSPELVNPGAYFKGEKFRNIQSIREDGQGRLLIGTGYSGAIRWNYETDEIDRFINEASDLNTVNSNDVHFLFEDSNENLWFGYHFVGLSMMYFNSLDYSFTNLGEELDIELNSGDIFHVTEDDEGNLWFPTEKGLIYKPKDGGSAKIYNPKETIGLRLSIQNENKLFLTSFDDHRIYTFDLKKHSFKEIFRNDSIRATPFFTESVDQVYISTFSNVILSINKGSEAIEIIKAPFNEIKKGERIFSGLMRDVEGTFIAQNYYFDSDREIETFTFDPENNTFKEIDIKRKYPQNNRTPDFISRTEALTIWSRNEFGLTKSDLPTGESVTYFEGEPLIQENATGSLVEDNDGYIWMNNATGIMQLDPATQSISQYQIRKEYRPEAFLKPFILSNGDIVFTGTGGYLRFNPAQAQVQLSVSNLNITELSINEKTYNLLFEDLPNSFSYNDNDISISYTAFNYLDPSGTNYRYRVTGFDDSWHNVGNQRRVFLANLPAGSYEFEVQASTRYGSFETSQSISLNILPPWWQTWWAYILYAGLLGLILFLIYRAQKSRTIRIEREKNRDVELAQAKEIQKAYKQLQETQNQLIQAEKMASLGELTAGIAHEIQNPLNFVNNFADINRELIDEQIEEINNKNYEEVAAIATDIKSNEEKIIHHGKRAEEIVKSMLLHSRGSEGKRELMNINALADEYLRLSYHGLRAKDKSFNADFKLNLDDSIPEIEVIPQEIGRVFLNLINNAFHATLEKAKSNKNGYSPTVEVITKKMGSHIEIIVQDNGAGVPDDIKEKIFQPFFTTKAAGTGTGLGLSLSYDIVTKGHGGMIKVESKEGDGTKFIISIPIQKS